MWSTLLLILILYLVGVFTSGDNFLKRVFNLKKVATETSLEDIKDKKKELQEKYSLTNYFNRKAQLLIDHQIETYEAKLEKIKSDVDKTVQEKKDLIEKVKADHNYEVYQEKLKGLSDQYRQNITDYCANLLKQLDIEQEQCLEKD